MKNIKILLLVFMLIFLKIPVQSQTTLEYGDLLVLGIAAKEVTGGSGSGEEYSFVCFKTLTTNTTIDLTDNGWERCYLGYWGDTEGVIRATLTGGTITAGTVITWRNTPAGTFTNISPTAGGITWSFTSLNPGNTLDMNSGGDQLYFMQGGTWSDLGTPAHYGSYTGGRVLFGFNTKATWVASCSSSPTQNSNLYPNLQCFNLTPGAGSDFIKYTGDTTAATQRDWIDRVNNPTNWSNYPAYLGVGGYLLTGPNYAGGFTIPITAGGFSPGVWWGALTNDWFLCDNWENMRIPDTATNVTINNAVGPQPTINNSALANCADITIFPGKSLTVNNNGQNFDIYGTLTNNGTFTHTAGTVRLVGGKHKSIAGSGSVNFYNLILNKNTNSLTITLNRSIQARNNLTLTRGLFVTGVNTLEIGYSTANRGSLTMGTGIVVGNVKRWFTNATNSGVSSGGFPIGVAAYTRTAMIEFTAAPTAGGSLTAYFNTVLPADYYQGLPIWDGLQKIDNLANEGFWVITFADGLSGGTYTCSLTGTGFMTASTPANVRILKRPTAGGNWTFNGTHGSVIWPTVTRTGMSGFSQFAIGGLYLDGNSLPIELISFTAKNEQSHVLLNWSTATETNNDFFTVEHSSDAKLFNTISIVKGAGNSNQLLNYSAVDNKPLKGINYYRLKQTDYDSKFSYSNLISLNVVDNSCETEIVDFLILNNMLYFTLSCINSNLKIDISDVAGKIVFSQIITSNFDSQLISIPLLDLKSGMYVLKIANTSTVKIWKFIQL